MHDFDPKNHKIVTYDKNIFFLPEISFYTYCRLNGSYENLDGGNISDALVDFTGGVAELVQLRTDSGAFIYRVSKIFFPRH